MTHFSLSPLSFYVTWPWRRLLQPPCLLSPMLCGRPRAVVAHKGGSVARARRRKQAQVGAGSGGGKAAARRHEQVAPLLPLILVWTSIGGGEVRRAGKWSWQMSLSPEFGAGRQKAKLWHDDPGNDATAMTRRRRIRALAVMGASSGGACVCAGGDGCERRRAPLDGLAQWDHISFVFLYFLLMKANKKTPLKIHFDHFRKWFLQWW